MVRVLLLLVPALAASGCIFCGPQSFFTSSITATTVFLDEAWNATAAAQGVQAAGFDVIEAGSAGVAGGPLRVAPSNASIHFSLRFEPVTGSGQDEVDRAVDERRAEAMAILAAFERGSGWRAASPIALDFARGHGDC